MAGKKEAPHGRAVQGFFDRLKNFSATSLK